jgi:hypothetical protein
MRMTARSGCVTVLAVVLAGCSSATTAPQVSGLRSVPPAPSVSATRLLSSPADRHHNRPPNRLLFETLNGRSLVVYHRGASPATRRVGHIGGLGTLSFSASGRHVVWEQDLRGRKDLRPGGQEIVTATIGRQGQQVLLGPSKRDMDQVVVAGRYVYWGTARGLGRVRLAGGRRDFNFRRLPPVPGADPVTGLASDGRSLYFSECERDRIGRIRLNRAASGPQITWLTGLPPCPQSITLANHYLYFTYVNRSIGRIDLLTRHVDAHWLNTGTPAVSSVAAAGHFLYWDAAIPHRGQRPREFLGRVDLDTPTPTHIVRQLRRLADSDIAAVTPSGQRVE